MNDVLSSWEEMKIEHIRNAIDAQRGVMLEIIEKQGGPTTFLSSNTSYKTWTSDLFKEAFFFPDWEQEAPLAPFFKSIYLCEFERYAHVVST